MERIDLHEIDQCAIIWFSPSISLATFYCGHFSFEQFQARTALVLEANPWLAGRLKGPQGHRYVEFDRSCRDVGRILHTVSAPADLFTDHLNYSRLSEIMVPHCAQNGDWACNRNEALFKVTVFRNNREGTSSHHSALTPEEEKLASDIDDGGKQHEEDFLILFSLCHAVGDAATLFQLIRLFNTDVPVVSLNPFRNVERLTTMMKMIGGEEMGYLILSGALFAGHVMHLLCNNKRHASVVSLSETAIAAEKLRWVQEPDPHTTTKGPVPFVSSNDLITSWLSRTLDSTFSVMSINMRDRLHMSQTEPFWAGNYTSQILYRRGDYEDPRNIRRSLQTLKRVHTYPAMPTAWETFLQKGFVVVTNWTAVYEPLHLPSCRFLRQIPIYPTVLLMHVAVIFRYADSQEEGDGASVTEKVQRDAGQTAMLLITQPRVNTTLHDDVHGLFGDVLL